ncbi:PUA-like domain-containing protein [Tricharina praecox]|uniref:PUA-like domain-containing protein n=1 Tax=Tricharina praecox TaxID=43433 RepID=UPI00221ED744|nr:PUA-like domain-containing protein [Tricharina praecox]KAI5840348.1 PUA-like domain-containing protein [Tricharina praecox]
MFRDATLPRRVFCRCETSHRQFVAGFHPPLVGGIFGAYSVVLSAGYPEDLDDGDKFTYTGAGGRDLKRKNLRTATQSKDQYVVRGNAGLHESFQTGNPIRGIRECKNPLRPETGYRYNGLYKVVDAYTSKSQDGKFLVWQFDFEKISGQKTVDYYAKEIKCKVNTLGNFNPNKTATLTGRDDESENGDYSDYRIAPRGSTMLR